MFQSQKYPTEGYHIPRVYLPCQQKKHMYLCIVLLTYESFRKPEILLITTSLHYANRSKQIILFDILNIKHYRVSYSSIKFEVIFFQWHLVQSLIESLHAQILLLHTGDEVLIVKRILILSQKKNYLLVWSNNV